MPPRHPTCQAAVQRHLPISLESIWVSDDLLRQEWRRFVCGSKTCRRYGSFVPGPLESRRRMGKRRMANLTEAFSPPSYNVASLWSSLWGEADRTQWQWQAPRKQDSTMKENTLGWLAELTKPQEESLNENSDLRLTRTKKAVGKPSIHKDIAAYRQRMKGCHPDDLTAICTDLNRMIKRHLTLGEIPELAIMATLRGVSNNLRHSFPNVAADICLSFYTATWDGLVACSVLRPDQLSEGTTRVLLKLVSKLPFTSDVQLLAFEIMSKMSQAQLNKAAVPIHLLLDNMLGLWLQNSSFSHPIRDIGATWEYLERIQLHNNELATRNTKATPADSRSLEDAKLEVAKMNIAAREAIEHHIPKALVEILQYLPRKIRTSFILRGSKSVSRVYNSAEYLCSDIRYSWLTMVSQIQGVKFAIFNRTWKAMEVSAATLRRDFMTPLHENIMSSIVLRFWIRVGWVKRPALVQQVFDSICSNEANPGFGSLVHVLETHQEDVWRVDGQLFKMLSKLGRFNTIYQTISHMKWSGITIPVGTCASVVQAMALHDPPLALKTFTKCMSMRARKDVVSPQSFPHERYPQFILSMIQDARINPNSIWKCLDVPAPKRNDIDTTTLPPAFVDLITSMAATFVRCETRSPRTILRNVERCVQILRIHRVTPDPRLSRAVARAAVNLKIEFDKLVPTQRADWAVRIIRAAEGPEVAATVFMMIDIWNRRKLNERKEERRNQNVLRVGPID